MTLGWREFTHFEDLHQVVQVLDVAAVMPAKHVRLLAVDQVGHGIDPARIFNSCQPPVLCILHNLEDVTTLQGIAIITDAARHSLKLAACLALFGR